MVIASTNPANGKVVRRFAPLPRRAIEERLVRASRAFVLWKKTPMAKRATLMRRAAALVRRDAEKLAGLATIEMGKPIVESRAEVEKCAWVCEYYAENAAAMLRDEEQEARSQQPSSRIVFEPIGAVLAIMPWNFPYWQVFRFAAPTLMAGNVGLLKHASNVPQCAAAIEAIFLKSGFPQGVFANLPISIADVERLIADDRVAAVTITGSERAGARVASLAGQHIKKSVLELGGSDPFIVLADADLAAASAMAVKARMINAGQSCIAAKRFIVVREVAEQFTEHFVAHMSEFVVGDPMDERTQVGPLARADLAKTLHAQVQASVKKGARILLGGAVLPLGSAFYAPTVLTNVRPGMPAYDEELFGPVASIIIAKDANDAVRIANDTRFGLGASVWTRNRKKAEEIGRRLDAGVVVINNMVKSDPRLPFGGIKKSGYGRELGVYGIREFVNVKSFVVS